MNHSALYVENDNVLVMESLVDQDGAAVTDATVTLVSIIDEDDAEISGMSFPTTMPHDSGGTYKVVLPAALAVVAGKVYRAIVTADAGGVVGKWTEVLLAKVRRN